MNRIITIGREFGSGGRELGRRLAEKFHIAYYDQEIITKLAQRMDLSEEYLRQVTERRPIIPFPINVGRSFTWRPIRSLSRAFPPTQNSISCFGSCPSSLTA